MFAITLSALLAQSAFPVAARPAAPRTTQHSVKEADFETLTRALSSATQVQNAVFAYLQEKTGQPSRTPSYPTNSLLSWSLRRYNDAPDDPKTLYGLVAEDLHIAQSLLIERNARQQRRGLQLANSANLKVAVRLRDKWLYARIHEGFLLPNLSAAPVEGWRIIGRQRLIEDAASAFAQSAEPDKQMAALQWLLVHADTPNLTDWARIQLAQAFAAQEKYEQAIALLRAVQTPDMNGSKRLIAGWEQRLRSQRATAPPPQTQSW